MKCKSLSTNEDNTISQFIRDGNSTDEARLRVKSLKSACNALFCNENTNLDMISGKEWPEGSCKKNDENCKNIISGEPICFSNIREEDIEKEAARILAEKNKVYPEINSKKGQKMFANTYKSAIMIIILPILIISLYGFTKRILIPYVIIPSWKYILLMWRLIYLYVLQNIRYFFTGFKILPPEYDLYRIVKTNKTDANKLTKAIKEFDKLLETLNNELKKITKNN
jgi:hypothetical protein